VLRPGIVETLRWIEDGELDRALTQKPTPREDIKPGDRVRFIDTKHHLFGKEGVFLRAHGRGRCMVFAGWKDWNVEQDKLRKIHAAGANVA
jgi:hypothetical protein